MSRKPSPKNPIESEISARMSRASALAADPQAMQKKFDEVMEANPKMAETLSRIVPSVFNDEKKHSQDLFSFLNDQRVILVTGGVDDQMADLVCAQLLYLDHKNPTEPIEMYINSPGGSVTAGLAIYDTMRFVKAPVHTTCMGLAASMGSILLTAGDVRSALPNAEVMIHQPLGGTGDRHVQESDFKILANHMESTREKLTKIYVDHTGIPQGLVHKLLERDCWLKPELAKALNLIDNVVPHSKQPPFKGLYREEPESLTKIFNAETSAIIHEAIKAVEEAKKLIAARSAGAVAGTPVQAALADVRVASAASGASVDAGGAVNIPPAANDEGAGPSTGAAPKSARRQAAKAPKA